MEFAKKNGICTGFWIFGGRPPSQSIWDCPFFWNLTTSQLVTSQKPQTNELLQRKVTQTKKGNTKHNQTTTILFFTLLLTYGFLETIQIQTQEENIG